MNDMKIELIDLNVGDKVWIDGPTSFSQQNAGVEIVEKITYQFDEMTGEKYKVIWINTDHKFDSRDGWAMNAPTMYYIEPIEQNL